MSLSHQVLQYELLPEQRMLLSSISFFSILVRIHWVWQGADAQKLTEPDVTSHFQNEEIPHKLENLFKAKRIKQKEKKTYSLLTDYQITMYLMTFELQEVCWH